MWPLLGRISREVPSHTSREAWMRRTSHHNTSALAHVNNDFNRVRLLASPNVVEDDPSARCVTRDYSTMSKNGEAGTGLSNLHPTPRTVDF